MNPESYQTCCKNTHEILIKISWLSSEALFPSVQEFLKLLTWYHLFHPWLPTTINTLWSSDAIWCNRSGSTLVQVMTCCLAAPSHYLNQCWLIINSVNTCGIHLGAIWQEVLMNLIPDICWKITLSEHLKWLPPPVVNELNFISFYLIY